MDDIRRNDALRVVVKELRRFDGTPVEVAVLAVKVDYQFSPRLDREEVVAVLNYAAALDCAVMTPGGRNQPMWAITPKGRIAEL